MGWLVRRLGVADVVTLLNGAVGFAAGAIALQEPALASRLVLLAAILDAIDGIVARRYGNTEVGPLLDSVTDVVSFGVTPALLIVGVGQATYGPFDGMSVPLAGAILAVGAIYALASVVRTALYTTYVDPDEDRPGIQNTLAATILAAAFLADVMPAAALAAATVVLAVAMVAPLPYPKLRAGDAIVLGVVQIGAVAAPTILSRAFPRIILVAAVAYAVGAPWFYWGRDDGATVSRVD